MYTVLMVNKYYWRKGGSEAVYFSEKGMLEEAGHQVVPFSMKSKKNEMSPYSKYFVDEVNYTQKGLTNRVRSASKIIYSFEAKKRMTKLLNEIDIDLAHFHIFQHQISPSVFDPLRKAGVPRVLTLHDLKPICPNYKMYTDGSVCEACKGGKFINCLKNKCTKGSVLGSFVNMLEMYLHYARGYYQNVDRYIAVSKFYRQKMIDFGFSPEKIAYLPNYVEAEDFTPSKEDKGYFLYFGRLSEEKGIETFLNSAADNSDIPYFVAGSGPLEIALKRSAKEKNLSNVKFLGFKQGEELKRLVSEATCVVIPSEWYENCPMTILETFASGRPVIGADIGGIPELIERDTDGLVFKSGDSSDLSEKIRWIWMNRRKAQEMGRAGRIKIKENFNAEVHYEGLMSIYKSVI